MNQFIAAKPKGEATLPRSPLPNPQPQESARPADELHPPVRRAPPRKPRTREVEVLEQMIAYLEQVPRKQAKRILHLLMRLI